MFDARVDWPNRSRALSSALLVRAATSTRLSGPTGPAGMPDWSNRSVMHTGTRQKKKKSASGECVAHGATPR
jgi:hypothetical protein